MKIRTELKRDPFCSQVFSLGEFMYVWKDEDLKEKIKSLQINETFEYLDRNGNLWNITGLE